MSLYKVRNVAVYILARGRGPSRLKNLAGGDGRPWDGVVIEVVVDVDGVAGVSGFESTWDGNLRAQVCGTSTCHGELCTADVELGSSGGHRVVDGEGLDPEQIVTCWDACWKTEGIGL